MTATPDFPVEDAPPTEFPKPDPDKAKDSATSVFKRRNAKRKSPSKPRQLTDDDIEKLEAYYGFIALPLGQVNARASVACLENANAMAESWRELAAENDAVRRTILLMLEGGAWGAVITAHLPLVMAFLPDMRDRFGFLTPHEDEPAPQHPDEAAE